MNHSHYEDYNLTLTRDSIESNAHFLSRLVAFAFCSHRHVSFSNEKINEELPLIISRDFDQSIKEWIDVGFVGEKKLKHSFSKSLNQTFFLFQDEDISNYQKFNSLYLKAKNAALYFIEWKSLDEIEDILINRSFDCSINIDSSEMWLSFQELSLELSLKKIN